MKRPGDEWPDVSISSLEDSDDDDESVKIVSITDSDSDSEDESNRTRERKPLGSKRKRNDDLLDEFKFKSHPLSSSIALSGGSTWLSSKNIKKKPASKKIKKRKVSIDSSSDEEDLLMSENEENVVMGSDTDESSDDIKNRTRNVVINDESSDEDDVINVKAIHQSWICSKCTFENLGHTSDGCEMCDGEKLVSTHSKYYSSSQVKTKSMEPKKGRLRLKKKKIETIVLDSEAEAESAGSSSEEFSESDEEVEDDQVLVDKILRKTENISQRILKQTRGFSASKNSSSAKGEMSDSDDDMIVRGRQKSNKYLIKRDEVDELFPKGYSLKNYQLVGLNWMWLLHREKISGILADEMGLGKTVQAIALLVLLSSVESRSLTSLIVVPGSTLGNWKREFSIWAPHFKVAVYHGTEKERFDIQSECGSTNRFDVMLTTYHIFERESYISDRKYLYRFNFDYLICDEGHSIRDINSSRYKNLSRISTKQKLMLTGTPLNGHLHELYAMLCFTFPTIFNHENKILSSIFDNSKKAETEAESSAKVKQFERVRKILEPFILRREKSTVLKELVGKETSLEMIEMTSDQKKMYDGIVTAWKDFKALPKKKGVVRLNTDTHMGIFMKLRKASNHPLLIMNHYKEKLPFIAKALHGIGAFGDVCTYDMVLSEISSYSDFQIHNYCLDFGQRAAGLSELALQEDDLFSSAKMRYLKDTLPKLKRDGHRVLLFSQFTTILDIFESFLPTLGFQYLRLDGSTLTSSRQELIDKFNKDTNISCFLLSTRAGGLGINLTAADVVILHDLDWNPVIDRQAEDRCHRIGQTKTVKVIKLVTTKTVDENIYKIAEEKLSVNAEILSYNKKGNKTETQAAIARRILKNL